MILIRVGLSLLSDAFTSRDLLPRREDFYNANERQWLDQWNLCLAPGLTRVNPRLFAVNNSLFSLAALPLK